MGVTIHGPQPDPVQFEQDGSLILLYAVVDGDEARDAARKLLAALAPAEPILMYVNVATAHVACVERSHLREWAAAAPEVDYDAFLKRLRHDCEYAEDPEDDPDAVDSVDSLIDYKNALEETLGRVVAEGTAWMHTG